MLDPIKLLIQQVLDLINPILLMLPPSWRDPAAAIFAIVLLIVVLVGIAQRLIAWAESTWKLLPLTTKSPPSSAKSADPAVAGTPTAPTPAADLTRDAVLANVVSGRIDRQTAEWLFAQISVKGAAPSQEAHDAFVETVQTMAVAPRPGEIAALEAIANGDAGNAITQLTNTAGAANPEQLKTLAAIAAPVNPALAMETFSRFAAATTARQIENPTTAVAQVDYTPIAGSSLTIGIRTGDIAAITDADTWVNSENNWLMMARAVDATISANIRYLSAKHDPNGIPLNDPVQKALRPRAYGRVKPIPLGSVRFTKSGRLEQTHGVKRILHVVSVSARPLRGARAGPDPGDYVRDVIRAAERYNRGMLRRILFRPQLTSMIMPMLGTGMGGGKVEDVADLLVDGMIRGAAAIQDSRRPATLKQVHMLAFSTRQYIPLRNSFDKRVTTGHLILK
jgi:O-acetyl-ADP-ribose deacetylase (regulator of RNase III)